MFGKDSMADIKFKTVCGNIIWIETLHNFTKPLDENLTRKFVKFV